MRKELKEYANVALSPEDLQGKIDFAQVFGRCGPVHIEIGSGKGTFLVNQAQAQPEVNFLGIEWARKYYRYVVDRIGRRGLTNVRMLRADAATFLRDFVPEESVDCFHIYFPDPWPKKRHHKRRLLQSDNLEMLLDASQAGRRDPHRHRPRGLLPADSGRDEGLPRQARTDRVRAAGGRPRRVRGVPGL